MFGLACIALPNFVAFKIKSRTPTQRYNPIPHLDTSGHIIHNMAKSSDIHKVCSDIGVTTEMVAKSRVYGNPSKFSYAQDYPLLITILSHTNNILHSQVAQSNGNVGCK